MASSRGEDASKDALRDGYVAACAGLSPRMRERMDSELLIHLINLSELRKARMLLGYVPYRSEIDCAPVMEDALSRGVAVGLPKATNDERSLKFVRVDSLSHLRRGPRGFLEPHPRHCEPLDTNDEESVCLVPGLVFDARGYRIGYGAGYYDNFLRRYRGLKVGVARSLQVSGNPLPVDAHDVPVDVLVSDAAIWQCRREHHRA